MELKEDKSFARYNMLSAALVFLISFGVYMTTIAPSVAFWDCGEYISASHTLGIPHPPGNPLFVIIMRVASIFLDFFEDVAFRMNFVIALASALTAMVMYLIVTEAGKMMIGKLDTAWKRLSLYIGGIVGGLFTAFGYTFWFNATEMSVYNLSMLVIAVCTLLMLKWAQSKASDRDKYLILVAFLGFLGIGLHMFTMLIFPPAFLFMVLWDEKKRYDWRLWATGILMASIVIGLSKFLWVAPIVLAVNTLMSFLSKNHKYEWKLCCFFSLFAIIGYSIHLFIPIRAALEPMINQNHPSTWEAFIGFLERKQYGSESMFTRMFWRRGLWSSQFGIEGHMGYGGFHLTQFYRFDFNDTAQSFFSAGFFPGMTKLLAYLVPTALMIYGWTYYYKKNRPAAIFLVALMLLMSIGMVFFMNFADGNRPERYDFEQWIRIPISERGPMPTVHREVRIRDYFFTGGFMFFGMWVGLASACLLNAMHSAKDHLTKKVVAPICAVLLALSPAVPAVTNYKLNNRSGDYLAYDYGYNLLNSCDENGIIFTYGDNDTYPLWALQEAYGVRKDVRVVNLSLVNMAWYIKQLKKLEPRVPISHSEEQIDLLQIKPNEFTGRPIRLPNSKLLVTSPTPAQTGRHYLQIQDQMILNIADMALHGGWARTTVKDTITMTVSKEEMNGYRKRVKNWNAKAKKDTTVYFDTKNNTITKIFNKDRREWVDPKPVYFVNTSERDLMGLAPFLQAQGLVYKLMPERVTADNAYNLERTIELIDSVYLFRGIGKAIYNNTSRSYITNYLHLANEMQIPLERMRRQISVLKMETAAKAANAENDSSASELGSANARLTEMERQYDEYVASISRFIDRCAEMMPWDERAHSIRFRFYVNQDKIDEAITALEQAMEYDPANKIKYEAQLSQVRSMKKS